MERVHEAVHDGAYDLIIVDTPPAQSTMEILDAPSRLVRFLDQRVVRWFLQPVDDDMDMRGGALTNRLLSAIAGQSLVSALTGFLREMAFLREGFAERAKDVRDRMRSAETELVLVSSADAAGVAAADSVARVVEERGFDLGHVVFNRAFLPGVAIAEPEAVVYPFELAALATKLERVREWLAAEQARKGAAIEAFCGRRDVEEAWMLPEATRPLGDPAALLAWMTSMRAVRPRP
jgi:anion-transporting  ArsA/GET3 family ATPase